MKRAPPKTLTLKNFRDILADLSHLSAELLIPQSDKKLSRTAVGKVKNVDECLEFARDDIFFEFVAPYRNENA